MPSTPNNLDRFRESTERHLLPMLPGAVLDPNDGTGVKQMQKYASVGTGAVRIKIRAEVPSKHYLSLHRSQKFLEADLAIADAFAKEFHRVSESGLAEGDYRDALVAGIPQRVVVRIVAAAASLDPSAVEVLGDQIELLRSWASQTYEGQSIASGLGLDATQTGRDSSFANFANVPAAKVVGDGVNSFYTFASDGQVVDFVCLDDVDESGLEAFRYPHVFRRIAHWTHDERRTVVCLTRRGETLVFAKGALQFASRRGGWLHMNHDGALLTWTKVHDRKLRQAIFATTLDAPFSRSGACIAVLKGHGLKTTLAGSEPINISDQIADTLAGAKGALLRTLVGERKFQNLPREIRRQLVAIDGAVVLGPDGTVHGAGAIVKVPGGSDGGGRLAATRALATYGFAVKVSADGEIRAYQGQAAEPVYVGL